MPAAQELLPCTIAADPPVRAFERLGLYWTGRDNSLQSGILTPKGGTLPVANLTPRPARPGRVLIQTRNPSGFGAWVRKFVPSR